MAGKVSERKVSERRGHASIFMIVAAAVAAAYFVLSFPATQTTVEVHPVAAGAANQVPALATPIIVDIFPIGGVFNQVMLLVVKIGDENFFCIVSRLTVQEAGGVFSGQLPNIGDVDYIVGIEEEDADGGSRNRLCGYCGLIIRGSRYLDHLDREYERFYNPDAETDEEMDKDEASGSDSSGSDGSASSGSDESDDPTDSSDSSDKNNSATSSVLDDMEPDAETDLEMYHDEGSGSVSSESDGSASSGSEMQFYNPNAEADEDMYYHEAFDKAFGYASDASSASTDSSDSSDSSDSGNSNDENGSATASVLDDMERDNVES